MKIDELVKKYSKGRKNFLKSSYNETQLRNDFIDPLLKIFGWDVDNSKGKTEILRDVMQEESIFVHDEIRKKNPDYTLRIDGSRKLFVEVKKPSIKILNSNKSAFQIRRYGWSANLGFSILTNFENLVIYDCRYKPNQDECEKIARYKIYSYNDYVELFEEIKDLVSYNSINSGAIEQILKKDTRDKETFDEYFLNQIETWREKLAISAINENKDLNEKDVNFIVQRLLNRIIFLRISEDRSIERYETLKKIKTYKELKKLFYYSDKKFNSGLFNFIEDSLTERLNINSDVLIEIFNELYFPLSPYDFSVVDSNILSQIYEQFLGKKIKIIDNQNLEIIEIPEVAASNGVVPTPKIIVDQIVKETLSPLIKNKSIEEIKKLKIADICCGSGTFLISAYDFILKNILEKLIESKNDYRDLTRRNKNGSIILSLEAKRNIIKDNLFGIDINPYAVEVTEFSLLLKLLEDEDEISINDFINEVSEKILPNLKKNIKCGNSVVDYNFFNFLPEILDNDVILNEIKPFNLHKEFSFLDKRKGFDAIIGNPPYVRIQNLKKYSPEEVKYYQSSDYGYEVAKKQNIDKYFVFIQRAIELLNDNGLLGYIVPHKFFITISGKELRKYIIKNSQINKLLHFGTVQVFPKKSTYTAILILQKSKSPEFQFVKINKISEESFQQENNRCTYKTDDFSNNPWIFLSKNTKNIFNKLNNKNSIQLNKIAEIVVGLQTSKDEIYIFKPKKEDEKYYFFSLEDKVFKIEKSICKPAIYKMSFDLFDTIVNNAQIIFPYKITNGNAQLLEESELKEKYPFAWKYLNEFKNILEKRSLNGRNPIWYQYGRSQSLNKFHNEKKLIWSVLATTPPYILDENNIQFTGGGNGPYYGLLKNSDYSLYYILGILSHPVIEKMVKSRASEFRGDYYSHGKQFIKKLPIRKINFDDKIELKKYEKVIKLVKNLISSKERLNKIDLDYEKDNMKRKYNFLYESLINVINDLYDINDEEFQTIINEEI